MSGYNSYTSWIHGGAGYLMYYGSKVKIKDTFFTSGDGCHNSDEFNIKLENGDVVGFDNKSVDWDDLHKRYRKNLSPSERKRQDKDDEDFAKWMKKITRKNHFVVTTKKGKRKVIYSKKPRT